MPAEAPRTANPSSEPKGEDVLLEGFLVTEDSRYERQQPPLAGHGAAKRRLMLMAIPSEEASTMVPNQAVIQQHLGREGTN
jgi:hypothetical protein